MLKKVLLMISLVLSITAITTITLSCSSSDEVSIRKAEGWIDANTYRAIGLGKPSGSSNDAFQRKILSKDAAFNNAREKMLSHITSSYMNSLSKSEKELVDEETLRELVTTRMRGGIIMETDWDGNENCMVTYEVSSRNLRSQVDKMLEEYTKKIKEES